jgi:hypothetical protein
LAIGSVLLATVPSRAIAANPDNAVPWKALWIGAGSRQASAASPGQTPLPSDQRMPIFRREFAVAKPVRTATLRVSGLGQFEAHINGRNVTDAVLTPGWTDYKARVFFDTYDVTRLLHAGGNAIGVMLGNGMYSVEETKGRYTKFAASFGAPRLILQLDLTYTDLSTEAIVTDSDWKTSPGPITYSSTYGGEDYDARLEQPGWDKPAFRDNGWVNAAVVPPPGGKLLPESIPPVRLFERFKPISVTHPSPGITVYDLGQNFAGIPEITVTGPSGARVRLICGELLDASGRVTQKSAYAFPDSENAFNYVLKGRGREHWAPRFSYYGFRYVEAQTSPDKPVRIVSLQGRFLHDDVRFVGTFTSSDKLFNRIHRLINRAMLSNMVSVLTDCPHREKLGWLEQTHLAASSLMYNYDLHALYSKIADDVEDTQLPNGMVPDIAPEYPVFEGAFRDSPEWGAESVLGPWTAYQFYGDLDLLRTHYASMKRYLAYLHGRLENNLLTYGLGDWYDIGPADPGESQLTPKGLTATAIYFQMLTTMRRIALLLDRPADASEFTAQSEAIKEAFNNAFLHPDSGGYGSGSQTANAMPLVIGLVPDRERAVVLASLVADIRRHSNHVTAGDIGFHYVVRALTDSGRSDVLYDMLSRTDKPSYGDQLAHGATALTEAWDANPASSQNHFMLGHAEEWFYRGLAGIDFDLSRDADARIRIEPAIAGDIQSVNANLQSALGKIESQWTRKQDRLDWRVRIPSGATATLVLPSGHSTAIRVNHHALVAGGAVQSMHVENGKTVCVVLAGVYRFHLAVDR